MYIQTRKYVLYKQGWENTISNTLQGLLGKQKDTTWPRDTLFRYLQIMENLQENMKEYQELQLIAGKILVNSNCIKIIVIIIITIILILIKF